MYFSVIVTVYRVEPYLKDCIDSILAQSFEDFELILVDDGSPDNCPTICDAYARADRRVKVIHQENRGVTAARKSGLKEASGRYVTFVDGDDRIMPEFLKRGYEKIEGTGAEMIVFSCIHEYEDEGYTQVVHEPVAEGMYEKNDIRKYIFPVLLMDTKMRHMTYYVSGKLISEPLAQRCFLTVDERISLGEDTLSIIQVYQEAVRIFSGQEPLHIYKVRNRSGAHGFRIERYEQIYMVLEELRRLEGSTCDLPEDFDRQILRYGAYICFMLMIHAVDDGQLHQIRKIRQKMCHPLLRECVREAQFKGISPKAGVTYWLFRKNLFLTSYLFLRLCKRIKKHKPSQ